MVPKMQTYLLVDNIEKPHDQVLRNYDFNESNVSGGATSGNSSTSADKAQGHNTPRTSQYNTRNLYTNLFDWKTLNDQSAAAMQERESHDPTEKDEHSDKRVNPEQKQATAPEDTQGKKNMLTDLLFWRMVVWKRTKVKSFENSALFCDFYYIAEIICKYWLLSLF